MKRGLALLAALALLLAACAARSEEATGERYELYYAALPGPSAGGDAISVREFRAEGEKPDAEDAARLLLDELLRPPEDARALSPFPSGTALQGLSVAGGRAAVDFSEHYARLSGVDLSIADYCVTLTLTQLDGINAVRITVNGRELPYRKTQLLTAADALLSGRGDVLRPINVSLYFLDEGTGGLRAQQQTLALYEGQQRVSALLDALLRGPEGDDTLAALLPEGFSVLSSRIDGGTCYVNLAGDTPLPADEALRQLAIDSLALSLESLSGVDAVQFLVDGEAAPRLSATVFAPEGEPASEA